MFGKDPRDVAIETLKAEVERLAAANKELTDRLLALTNPVAFQLVKREERPAPPKSEAEENVNRLKSRLRSPFVPEKTSAEIHDGFRAREGATG